MRSNLLGNFMDHAPRGGWRALVLVWLILPLPSSLSAQGKSHGYVSLGAGATDLNGGLDWVLLGGPSESVAKLG